ncbi:hypothetical protein [uncultured Paludibaculum sp.]|uniref:hypothetical protein n=1 Tax=uncultured Paludibaculum sp. TaxID=1765020 RepID=UPI002AAB98FD|nr:hypothetical protein [uncultured Paludibaculum sp.]
MNVTEKALKTRAKRIELEAQFPSGDCVLVSVQSDTHNTKGGLTMEAPVDNAARHLVEGTHRLATEDEIKAFRTAQAEQRKQIIAASIGQADLLRGLLTKAIDQRGK